jgi:protein HOOK3
MLKAIVYVALFSVKSNPHQVQLFQTTGLTTFSAPIKKMIDEMREAEDQLATSREPGVEFESSYTDTPVRSASHDRGGDGSRDKEDELLDMEAKWYETVSANNDLRGQVETLGQELEKSHRQVRNLEEQLAESEQSFKRKFEEYRERERQQHLAEGGMSDKDLIAQLESEVAEAKAQLESQGRQLHKFRTDDVSKQELRDQIQLLTFERDELQQKAKANENLKRKIQTLQEFERKYQGIADTLEDSKSKLEQYEDLKQRYEDLKRANQESLRTIQSCEQQIMVEAERNKILQHEKKHKEQELEQTKEFVQHYIDLKEELESKIRELESNGPAASRLDDELAMEDSSELVETPRATFPDGAGSGAEVLILQQKLELAESRAKRIEEQYLNTYEENLGLSSALKDVSLGNTAISSHPSVRLQDRLHATEEELKDSKEQRFAATAENASLRDQLAKGMQTLARYMAIVTKYTAASVDPNGERLDSATVGELDSLRGNHAKLLQDLADLQQYSKTVVEQLADQRSLLRRAMLKRLNGDEAVFDDDTLQRIKEQVSIPAHAPAAEKEDLIQEVSSSLAAELVKLNVSPVLHVSCFLTRAAGVPVSKHLPANTFIGLSHA